MNASSEDFYGFSRKVLFFIRFWKNFIKVYIIFLKTRIENIMEFIRLQT